MTIFERLGHYTALMRLNKPIGILLLLWPTLWALWLAGRGVPAMKLLGIFMLGVILMRSAGCIMNDIADRHYDGRVRRTRERPLAAGKLRVAEALLLLLCLGLLAFFLALQLNRLTLVCAVFGAALSVIYPFMKRFTHFPQLGIGLAFSWGVPMAFAAERGEIPGAAWCLFFTAMLWPLIYDTIYAMADREDDLKVGIKSLAILFGRADRLAIALLQGLFLVALLGMGSIFQLHGFYYASLGLTALVFMHHQRLIAHRRPECCMQAFAHNQWVGAIIFIGIALGCA